MSDELAGALAVPTDVTDPSQLGALVDAVVARHGRIDGLVNNAGASFHGPLEEIDLARYLDLLQLNVVSVVAAIQAVLPAADGIAVSLVLPSITATEFGGGMFRDGATPRRGMVVHSPEYVGRVILRALRTGEERIDIPHGPEQPDFPDVRAA